MSLKQVNDVDLKLLRIFCEIVDQKSFAAAQVRLNLSQSALSEYLKTLEIRLNMRLCNRGPGGFKLLKEGEEVYLAARQLFEAIETFKSNLLVIDEGLSGEVQIVVQDEIINNPSCRLTEALTRFTSEVGRRVRLNVEMIQGFRLVSHVAEGHAHIGVGLNYLSLRSVRFIPLFNESRTLYCAKGHPLFDTPDKSITEEMIRSFPYASRGNLVPRNFNALEQLGQASDVAHGAQAHALLILSQRDIGVLPDHFAQPYVERGLLRTIRPDITRSTQDLGILIKTSQSQMKAVDRLIDCLLETHGRPATDRRA